MRVGTDHERLHARQSAVEHALIGLMLRSEDDRDSLAQHQLIREVLHERNEETHNTTKHMSNQHVKQDKHEIGPVQAATTARLYAVSDRVHVDGGEEASLRGVSMNPAECQ